MRLSLGMLWAVLAAGMASIEPPSPRQRTRYAPPKRDDDLHMRKAEEKRQRRAAKRLQQSQRRPLWRKHQRQVQ